jgi:anti-sigma regulatory factor (Ser/Thr protein kinase)
VYATCQAPVTLMLPADPFFVRLVRVVAGSLAGDLEFDREEIGDLLIASDELTNAVMLAAIPMSTIEVSFTTDEGVVALTLLGVTHGASATLDTLSEQVLHQVCEFFSFTVSGGSIRAELRSSAPGVERLGG